MHSEVVFLNCGVAVEGCLYISTAGCKLLSPTLPSSERDDSIGAAKWHSAVRAHVIILYSVILVK